MSYNIDTWKISKLKLELPLYFDFQQFVNKQPDRDENGYENVGVRWCKEEGDKARLVIAGNTWRLSLLNQSLTGVISGDPQRGHGKLITQEIDWTDDFSGHLYHDILLPLFKEYRGELEAIVTWERGDTIERLTIHDGIAKEEEIA